MKRLSSAVVLIGALLANAQTVALDLTQSPVNKKQISGCMTKRMLADRTVSYNNARKACTEQLKALNASMASSRSTLRVDLNGASSPGLAR